MGPNAGRSSRLPCRRKLAHLRLCQPGIPQHSGRARAVSGGQSAGDSSGREHSEVEKAARHLQIVPTLVRTAQRYAQDYPEEIEQLIRDNERGFDALQRLLPDLEKG